MISVKTLTINYLRDMEIIIPPLALAFKQTKEEEKEKKKRPSFLVTEIPHSYIKSVANFPKLLILYIFLPCIQNHTWYCLNCMKKTKERRVE